MRLPKSRPFCQSMPHSLVITEQYISDNLGGRSRKRADTASCGAGRCDCRALSCGSDRPFKVTRSAGHAQCLVCLVLRRAMTAPFRVDARDLGAGFIPARRFPSCMGPAIKPYVPAYQDSSHRSPNSCSGPLGTHIRFFHRPTPRRSFQTTEFMLAHSSIEQPNSSRIEGNEPSSQ